MWLDIPLPGSFLYYLAMAVFAVCLIFVLFWDKITGKAKKKDTAETYAVLTRETLDALPDGEIVRAVAANLCAKDTDLYRMIGKQNRGRRVVFTVWVVCRSVERDGFYKMLRDGGGSFAEMSVDAFREIGAETCAAVVEKALAVKGDDKEQRTLLADLNGEFTAAAASEKPLDECAAYIRNLPDEFVDDAEKKEEE